MSLMIVVGNRDTTISGSEASVWAYNENSELQWSYDTGGNTEAVILDSSGNVYVVGAAADNGDGNGTRNVWKLNSSGTYLTGSYVLNNANATCIDIDDDYLYVGTGAGTVRTNHAFGGSSTIQSSATNAVKVDTGGNIYVGGGGTSDTLRKYNSSLVLQWSEDTNDQCISIDILSDGDVIIGTRDGEIRYYKSDGTSPDAGDWAVVVDGATGPYIRVAVDSNDNIYGVRLNDAGGSHKRFICLNTAGVEQWSITTDSGDLEDIFINDSDVVYIVGDRYGSVAGWKEDSQSLIDVLQSPSTVLKGITGTGPAELVPARIKVDHYTIYNAAMPVYGSTWSGQTFTAGEGYKIASVKLRLYKQGSPSGPFIVSIRAVDGGNKPTGGDLSSVSIEASGIITSSEGRYYELVFPSPYQLLNGIQYAIVIRGPGDTNNRVMVGVDLADLAYPGGERVKSTDAGVTWLIDTGRETTFETLKVFLVFPVITDQSGSVTVALGQQVNLFVTATGTPDPTYQWYKNDLIISGEVSSTYSFYADNNSAGVYKCKVTNDAGEVLSDSMVVTVVSNPYVYNPFDLPLDIVRIT